MSLATRIRREWRFLRPLIRTLQRVRGVAADSPHLSCDDIEDAVNRWRERPALLFEGKTLTYGEFDALANRYAHWAASRGLRRGSTVAILLPNRADYAAAWYGLTKIGVASALINNHLAGAALTHCLRVSDASHVIVDGETAAGLEAVRGTLEKSITIWTLGEPAGDQRNLSTALKGSSAVRPEREQYRQGMTAKDTALYIFTSGTTGMPKAARITHLRVQLYMRGFAAATGARADDRIFCALPLYHATGGLCVEARPGEIGECIGEIGQDVRRSYTGYADAAATEKKVLHDVFATGDAWFATGDLMLQDKDGYFYFVDRIGDTYRWKGENVSTTEVAERMAAAPGVREATVYGVQVGELDGRAGMASLVVGPEFDITALKGHLEADLPTYAQPVFIRLQPEIETTGTFKYRKMDLVADGFSPDRVRGPLYYKHPARGYVKLTKPAYAKIISGDVRL